MVTRHSRLLFWDVDTQFDFMEPDGKLYVPGAERILCHVRDLNAWAATHRILIVSSVDRHMPGDAELAQYGAHCMAGSPGQAKQWGTLIEGYCLIPNRTAPLPDVASCPQIVIEKQALDVFTNPNADALLKRIGNNLHIVLYGVVTELCVNLAAQGLIKRGHRVDIVEDAVRHLDLSEAEHTISRIKDGGGSILKTAEVLGGSLLGAA